MRFPWWLKGESDTVLSLPMKVPAVFRAAVGSVGGAITVAGTPNLTENQFVYSEGVQPQTHYLFFESGDLAGRHFRITGNTSSTISVADPRGELAGAAADDVVAIHPYWTLATLFSSDQGLALATNAGERPIEVILPAVDSDGINPSAEAIYYLTGRSLAPGRCRLSPTFDDTVLEPDRPVVVRMNQDGDRYAGPDRRGDHESELSLPIRSRADGAQDNLLSLSRPLDVTLDESGLAGSDAFETTTDSGQIKDRVILYPPHRARIGCRRTPITTSTGAGDGRRRSGD